MTDIFGFAGILNKFEEHWGRGPTKAILALFAIVATIGLFKIGYTFLEPILSVFAPFVPWGASKFANYFTLICSMICASTVASYVIDATRIKQARERIEELNSESHEILQRAKEDLAEMRAQLDQREAMTEKVDELIAAANMMFEDMVRVGVEHGLLPPARLEEIKEMLTESGWDELVQRGNNDRPVDQ